MSLPIAVVGVSWRTAPLERRTELAAFPEAALLELRDRGYLTGVARLVTCARVEYILTADEPAWAASLLQSSLLSRNPQVPPSALHARSGPPAVRYLMRMTVGLDSLAEGEGAIGRQVLKAIEAARARRLTDSRLHLLWKHLERTVAIRRVGAATPSARGVQFRVSDELQRRAVRRVAVLGRGEFGLATERALKNAGHFEVASYARTQMEAFLSEAATMDAVVVCTAGPAGWLSLPPGDGVCIDAGAPPQVGASPGRIRVDLNALLAHPGTQLGDEERAALETVVRDGAKAVADAFAHTWQASMLAGIDAARAEFLTQRLPALLLGIPRRQASDVQKAVTAFAHDLLRKAKQVDL